MYIEIKGKSENTKGILINNLSYNFDDILIKIENNNVMLFNKEMYLSGQVRYSMDETTQQIRLNGINPVKSLRELLTALQGEQFGNLELGKDMFVYSDLEWIDNGLNLPVRVVIPLDVVASNVNYLGLTGWVLQLKAENKANFYAKNGLYFMYFSGLLPEHEALLSADSNVLIEMQ